MKKKFLNIQYPAYLLPDVGLSIFQPLEYDVVRCDIAKYDELEHIEKILKVEQSMELREFDVVGIIVAMGMTFNETLLPPETRILDLKERLKNLSIQKGKPILFFGMDLSIPEPYCSHLTKLFDGLYIGGCTTSQMQSEILDKLRVFALQK